MELFCWRCAKTVRKEEIMISWRRKESRMFEHEIKFMASLGNLVQFHETLELSWSWCLGSLSKEFETKAIAHRQEMKVIFLFARFISSHTQPFVSFAFAFSASNPSQLHLSSSAIESESLPSRALSMLAHVIHIIFMMIRTFPLNYFYPRSSAQKISLNTVWSVM